MGHVQTRKRRLATRTGLSSGQANRCQKRSTRRAQGSSTHMHTEKQRPATHRVVWLGHAPVSGGVQGGQVAEGGIIRALFVPAAGGGSGVNYGVLF